LEKVEDPTSGAKKEEGAQSLNIERVKLYTLNCTREMAISYIDELSNELIDAGIAINMKKIQNGQWEGNIGASKGLVFGGSREWRGLIDQGKL